jgi:cAMP-dependent protein kinase regulator
MQLNYCRGWIEKKAESSQAQPESESDSEEEESRLSELQEAKGRSPWYEHRRGICAEVYGNHHLWEECDLPTVAKKGTVNSRILFRLKSLFLFKDFDDGEIMRLIGAMSEVSCLPGCLVIREGQTGCDMFVVDSGELECLKGSVGE